MATVPNTSARTASIGTLRLYPWASSKGASHYVTLRVEECTFEYLPQNAREPHRDYLRVRVTCKRKVLVDTFVGSPAIGWRNGEEVDGYQSAINALGEVDEDLAFSLQPCFDAWRAKHGR